MSAGLDMEGGVSFAAALGGLTAAVNGMCARMDQETQLRTRAAAAFRQAPFVISVPLVSGAASVNASPIGPPVGSYWSIRRMSAVGFTVGTVSTYVDNVNGEPLCPFPVAAINTYGKGEMLLHPNSRIAYTATGITGTVQIWGEADQFESWLLPWYMGAQRDAS
jgi:hypothetical protein